MKIDVQALFSSDGSENICGRIGDYSRSSALFLGFSQYGNEVTGKVFVYTVNDEADKNNPYPKFTSSGGGSPKIIHHLRHIFYKNQTEDRNKVIFNDIAGNKFLFFLSFNRDISVGTEDSDCEPGMIVTFEESHPLYQDLLLLAALIHEENYTNSERNPFSE